MSPDCDDECALHEVPGCYLAAPGLRVSIVTAGRHPLSVARTRAGAVPTLMDVVMPGNPGVDLIRPVQG